VREYKLVNEIMLKILVVGYAIDPQTKAQIAALKDEGAEVVILNPQIGHPKTPVSWSKEKRHFAGVDMHDIDGAIVRSTVPLAPSRQAFDSALDQRLDFRAWFQHSCAQRDRHDTALGLLLALGAQGVPLFNDPRGSHFSRRKPFQIETMRALGIDHPETLITNDPDEAKAFVQAQKSAIVKPAAGGALTLCDDDLSDDDYAYLRKAPAIFQERIFGRDLRVMVLDDKVISVAAIRVPEGTLDFRGDTQYRSGKILYDEVQLPKAIEAQAVAFAKAVGLRFCGIDIKHTKDERYVVLEVNSSPIYLDVEYKLKHPISKTLVQRLLQVAEEGAKN